MKYLIKESQFDKIIFKYLDNQDFIQIDTKDGVYFVNSVGDEFVDSEGDKYAQITYDKYNHWCYIYYKLTHEISSFFSIEKSDSERVIGRWVENTLQIRVTDTESLSGVWTMPLRIPSN